MSTLPKDTLGRIVITRAGLPAGFRMPPEHDGAVAVGAGVELQFNCGSTGDLLVLLKAIQSVEQHVRTAVAEALADDAIHDVLRTLDEIAEEAPGTDARIDRFDVAQWEPGAGDDGELVAKHKPCGKTLAMLAAVLGDHQQTCSATS